LLLKTGRFRVFPGDVFTIIRHERKFWGVKWGGQKGDEKKDPTNNSGKEHAAIKNLEFEKHGKAPGKREEGGKINFQTGKKRRKTKLNRKVGRPYGKEGTWPQLGSVEGGASTKRGKEQRWQKDSWE